MIITVKATAHLICILVIGSLSSCALVTVPVKVAGKAVTTTVGLAGKAAGAGINSMRNNKGDESSDENAAPNEN